MNPNKLFNSFAQNNSKDIGLVSTTARLNMNNSSSGGFLKLSNARNLFNINYSITYLSDLKKTLSINLDILKQYLSSTNINNLSKTNKNELMTLLNLVLEKTKKKSKILDKIKEKKSKILIDSQIITDKRRKIEEKNYFYKNKINEGKEGIDTKEEYMKVLHKKMREVEIYIHKNTVNLKNYNRKKKYQSFSMFNFVEINNELVLKKDKERNLIQKNNDEIKIKKISEKYKSKIKLMKLRVNVLRNAHNKLIKKIKILKIGELNNIENENNEEELKELDQIPLETSMNMKNSMMDFSVLNTQNFDDNKDISKFGMGNVSNIGIYDISIINQK